MRGAMTVTAILGMLAGVAEARSAPSAHAGRLTPTADPCEIAGVKLGMSSATVSSVLKETLGKPEKIRQYLGLSNFQGSAYVAATEYKYKNVSINIQFAENISKDRLAFGALQHRANKVNRVVLTFARPAGVERIVVPPGLGSSPKGSQCPYIELGPHYWVLSRFVREKKTMDALSRDN